MTNPTHTELDQDAVPIRIKLEKAQEKLESAEQELRPLIQQYRPHRKFKDLMYAIFELSGNNLEPEELAQLERGEVINNKALNMRSAGYDLTELLRDRFDGDVTACRAWYDRHIGNVPHRAWSIIEQYVDIESGANPAPEQPIEPSSAEPATNAEPAAEPLTPGDERMTEPSTTTKPGCTAFRLIMVDPNKIIVGEHRRPLNPEKVAELVHTITVTGFQPAPITIREIDGTPMLVVGAHRLQAVKTIGCTEIPAFVFEGDERQARMWEIDENLRRVELTELERDEQIAEWIKLAGEEVSAQVDPKPQGGRPESGINKAARDLGIKRKTAQRAKTIAGLSDEAKAAAVELGLDDNQSALLEAAKVGTADEQVETLKQRKERKSATTAAKATAKPSDKNKATAAKKPTPVPQGAASSTIARIVQYRIEFDGLNPAGAKRLEAVLREAGPELTDAIENFDLDLEEAEELLKEPKEIQEDKALALYGFRVVTGCSVDSINYAGKRWVKNSLSLPQKRAFLSAFAQVVTTAEDLDPLATLLASLTVTQQSDVIDRADRMRDAAQAIADVPEPPTPEPEPTSIEDAAATPAPEPADQPLDDEPTSPIPAGPSDRVGKVMAKFTALSVDRQKFCRANLDNAEAAIAKIKDNTAWRDVNDFLTAFVASSPAEQDAIRAAVQPVEEPAKAA